MPNLKVSEQSYPSTRYTEAAAPSTPAAGEVIVYAKADGLMYAKDDAGTETALSNAAGGNVATDAIWDAAGDLAVGSGANTAAKLAMGAEGSALSVMDGVVGWNGATSMPGSPTTGQRVWRSDLSMEFVYDGTRWVSTTLYSLVVPPDDDGSAIDTPSTGFAATREMGWVANPWAGTYDIWVTKAAVTYSVATTNDGSKNWTIGVSKRDSALAPTSLGTVSTSANSPGVVYAQNITVEASVANATYPYFSVPLTKVSTPGNIWVSVVIFYRIIAT